jgi:hypothetical protein
MNSRYPLNWRLGDLHIRPSRCRQKNLGHCWELKPDSPVAQAISLPSHSTAFTLFSGFCKKRLFTLAFLYVCKYACYVRPSVRLVCESVHMEQLGSHWKDFQEIWYFSIFRKFVKKIQVSLKPDKNNGYFMWRPRNIYDNISLRSS